MTWGWSHTNEAYHYAEEQVRAQPREWLETVFAEWRANQGKHGEIQFDDRDFNQRKYDRALAYAKGHLTDEQLADFIWERMDQIRRCTNGGWQAHCCPYGCGGHMVPFSPPEPADTDEEAITTEV